MGNLYLKNYFTRNIIISCEELANFTCSSYVAIKIKYGIFLNDIATAFACLLGSFENRDLWRKLVTIIGAEKQLKIQLKENLSW